MSGMKWTFRPYNKEEYKNSKHRIMFVGADPNGGNPNIDKKTKREITDMGELFKFAYENMDNNFFNNLPFFKRTEYMLRSILGDKSDSLDVFNSMRFIDLKAIAGGAEATTEGVRKYLENESNAKEVSNYFTDSKIFPHFIILLGGHVHTLFFEFRKNKKLSFHEKSLAVCMPHPSHSVHYEILDKVASEELNSKFKSIKDSKSLWKWHYKAKINTKKTPSEIIRDESHWSEISK
jgi:hypothetical protein